MTIKNKNGFAFSIFALFIAFILFAFGSLYLFESPYTRDADFINARISFIDREIEYFKDSYLENILTYSTYNTIYALVNYSRYNYTFSNNHPKLNGLVLEGLINGSFENNNQSALKNKTVIYFLDLFQNDFKNNFRGNFSFEILEINIFEERPYYLSLQVVSKYNISTQDNISSWSFLDEKVINFPIFDILDPEFAIQSNLTIDTRPSEFYLGNFINWTNDTLKTSIDNVYSTVYTESNFDYTVGTSFLNRLLNISPHSYEDVIGYWSFDRDEEFIGVYDSSLNNNHSYHFGNTVLLLKFDNNTVNSTHVMDSTAYNHTGTINGSLICGEVGINNEACFFNGVDSFVQIPNYDLFNFGYDDFSYCLWFFVNGTPTTGQIFSKRFGYGNYEMQVGSSRHLSALFRGNDSSGNLSGYNLRSPETIPYLKWHHTCFVRSGLSLNLYLNGQLVDSSSTAGDINVNSSSEFNIGWDPLFFNHEYFFGRIDEFGLYSKALSNEQVAEMYATQKVKFADYYDSLHTKGVSFDGYNDYIELLPDSKLNNFTEGDFSIDFWVKLYDDKFNLITFDGELAIGYNKSTGFYFTDDKNSILNYVPITLSNDVYYYFTFVRDSSTDLNSIYVNGQFIDSIGPATGFNPDLDGGKLYVGTNMTSGVVNDSLKGFIDEIKIYSRALNSNEIEKNYYNYESLAKGCCNYLTIINPNLMGFNNTSYGDNENISYSSKLFFEFYNHNITPILDITLFNISNFTSVDTQEEYYNLRFDACLMQAFNVFDPEVDSDPKIYHAGLDGINCSNLIRSGVY